MCKIFHLLFLCRHFILIWLFFYVYIDFLIYMFSDDHWIRGQSIDRVHYMGVRSDVREAAALWFFLPEDIPSHWEDPVLLSQEPPILRWCHWPNDGILEFRRLPSVWWGEEAFWLRRGEENGYKTLLLATRIGGQEILPRWLWRTLLSFFQADFFLSFSPPRGSEAQLYVPIFPPDSVWQ